MPSIFNIKYKIFKAINSWATSYDIQINVNLFCKLSLRKIEKIKKEVNCCPTFSDPSEVVTATVSVMNL